MTEQTSLSIGELAAAVGVSTRAVRYYQSRRLMPEALRDPAGFRRYGPDDVVRLSRIVALASAGVPLARIGELLDPERTDQAGFTAAVADINADVDAEIARLQAVRASLARLESPDALALPAVLAGAVAHLRSAGAPEAQVDRYRDAFILLNALYPAPVRAWAAEDGMYTDPAFLDLVARTLHLEDADPDDPLVTQLAADSAAWAHAHPDAMHSGRLAAELDDARANALIQSQWGDTPAWRRLGELVAAGLTELASADADGHSSALR